jgi:hypothetical protein
VSHYSRHVLVPCCLIIHSYGPNGNEIIAECIRTIVFPDRNKAQDELGSTLSDLISNKFTSDKSWRGFWNDAKTALSNPSLLISIEDFYDFIVFPWAVNLLIAEDLGVDEAGANKARRKSKRYGEFWNPKLDDVEDSVIKAPRVRHL